MKIVHNTPDQLVLKSVPWVFAILFSTVLLGAVAFGLNSLFAGKFMPAFWGLIGIPLFISIFIVVFARRDDLILDRRHNLLELRHSTLRGRKRVQHKLEHLQKAELQSTYSRNNGTMYRLALVLNGGMDAGTHPVTPVYTGGKGPKRAVDAINAWLAQDVDSGPSQA